MIEQAICSDKSVVFVLSMQIEEDKFMVLDGMTRCGRMFLGLGSLLVGSKVAYCIFQVYYLLSSCRLGHFKIKSKAL